MSGEADAEPRDEIYCGTIGAEFMHIPDPERRQWIIERLEGAQPDRSIARPFSSSFVEADIFEQMLQTLYIGTKRFSLEGNTALIPLLEEILNGAAEQGAEECVHGHEPSRAPDRRLQHRGPPRRRNLCGL